MNAAVTLRRPGPLAGLLLLAGVAGLAAPTLLDAVARFGAHIPQADMPGDYVVAWGWGFLIWASILLWPVREQDRRALLVLWGAKLAVTLGFMLLYENNYALLDAYTYFRAASAGDVTMQGVTGGTRRIVDFATLHPALLQSSYHSLKLTFALIGLIGVYVFYRAAVLASGRERPTLLLALGLFPSILFWSSILGKDPIMLLGVALYSLGAVRWTRGEHARGLPLLLAGIGIAMTIRFWMVPIMLLPAVPLLVPRSLHPVARAGLLLVGVVVVALIARSFARELQVAGLVDLLTAAGNTPGAWSGGSSQRLPANVATPAGFAAFLPLGAFTALFRPLLFEAHNAFALLAGVESTGLLLLLAIGVVRFRRVTLHDGIVRWALSFLVCWSGLYSVLSYQNLGAAVRFRSQILPILLLLLLHLAFRREQRGGTDDAKLS
jgi:hypothetical protein